jgi:predicted metallopeptidase
MAQIELKPIYVHEATYDRLRRFEKEQVLYMLSVHDILHVPVIHRTQDIIIFTIILSAL